MKLSIITATYNRPEKLSTIAPKSLLNQTDHNFEWIIINDGGTVIML
ncbi:glycosyltransferase [Nostoc sp. 'Peltigera malacea cyanobiont' DB3992]